MHSVWKHSSVVSKLLLLLINFTRKESSTNANDIAYSDKSSFYNYSSTANNRYFDSSTQSSSFSGSKDIESNFDGRGVNIYRDKNSISANSNPIHSINENSKVIEDATYFIVGSKMVRPGQIYRLSVSVLDISNSSIIVRASISRDGVEITKDVKPIKGGNPDALIMRLPHSSVSGDYSLKVEGFYNTDTGGIAFMNVSKLTFSQRSMTIFVQTDKPVYMQGENIKFRTIPITTELKGFDNAVDVYMIDPRGNIVRRWLSRQSNLGAVSLEYKLSDQPIFGEWIIRVIVQGQIEESKFVVEEYYQTRFEVNVTMPAFFFNSDFYINGKIMANFTNGAPVKGNLTLKATIRPIGQFNYKSINMKSRVWHYEPGNENEMYGYNDDSIFDDSKLATLESRDRYQQTNYVSDQFVYEKQYMFDEEWPFWAAKPNWNQEYNPYIKEYRNILPYLRYFNGTFDFKFSISELEQLVPNLSGMEVLITASVGERFYDEIREGYAMTRIYNSSIKASFVGGTPQVFKPTMPFTIYIVVEYFDSSPLSLNVLLNGYMELSGSVESRGGRRDFPVKMLQMSENPGIWEMKIDLQNDLNINFGSQSREFINEIQSMRLNANFIDPRGERTSADLLLLAHYSPQNHHIKVSTSTKNAKVGEYIIFHIETNFYADFFHYIVMSKGMVLLTGYEKMPEGIRTMAITLSAEMAPVATIVVWHVGQQGHVIADSLTFPVNGISRNNFTVFINNRKARTGDRVEVAIYGEAGAYVGLSGIDNAFYTMQAGNDLTYATVINKMSTFDEQTNGTLKHVWHFHDGNPDELVYFPSSSFGIDVNRTFEYTGLIVFSDVPLPRRYDNCNVSQGYAECLSGRCYRQTKQCDG